MERRRFLKSAVAAVAAGTGAAAFGQSAGETLGREFLTTASTGDLANLPRVSDPGVMRGEMLYRKLGSTGVEVSAIGMGGSHVGKPALSDD